MHFLKIDKKNLFYFSKIILVIGLFFVAGLNTANAISHTNYSEDGASWNQNSDGTLNTPALISPNGDGTYTIFKGGVSAKYTLVYEYGKSLYKLAETNSSAAKFYSPSSDPLSPTEYTPPTSETTGTQTTSSQDTTNTNTKTPVDVTLGSGSDNGNNFYTLNGDPVQHIGSNKSTDNFWNTSDGKIYILDKSSGKWSTQSPSDFAKENNGYNYKKSTDGTTSETITNYLNGTVKDSSGERNQINAFTRNLSTGTIVNNNLTPKVMDSNTVVYGQNNETKTYEVLTGSELTKDGKVTPETQKTTSLVGTGVLTEVIKQTMGGGIEEDKEGGECWISNKVFPGGHMNVRNCFYQGVYYVIFWPLSYAVGFVTWIFNAVFEYTVIKMSTGINAIGVINVAWQTMRDLANIGFIFILLYLAISTIIGAGEHDVKKTLSKLIFVAILLNFSLFFTKIIIDASNILALSFYDSINSIANGNTKTGLGDSFMNAFRFQGLFGGEFINTGSSSAGAAFARQQASLLVMLGGAFLMVLGSIIMLSAMMMFVKRYVILILVMIFSPLAFAGMILHQTEHSVQEWWNYLLKEAFFAPIFMIMLWISFSIMNDKNFLKAIGEGDGSKTRSEVTTTINDSLSNAILTPTTTSTSSSSAGVILDFMIVAALFISSLVVAEKMGVAGASQAISTAKGMGGAIQGATKFTAGAAFNNTVGRWAGGYLNKGNSAENLARAAAGEKGYIRQQFARVQIAGLKNLSSGHQKKLETEVKYREALDHEVHNDPATRLAMLEKAATSGAYSVARRAGDSRFDSWSAEDHANVSAAADMKIRDIKNSDKSQEVKDKQIASVEAAMKNYYTGGVDENGKHIHERIADKKSDVEKLKTDKLLNVQKNDLKSSRSNMKEFGEKFKALTDVQKQQYVATLGKDEQDALSIDKDFEDIMIKNANDFQSIEKFSRGASDGMKQLLSKIAYEGVARQKLFAKLQDKKFKDNEDLQKAFMDSFKFSGIDTKGLDIEQLKTKYQGSDRFSGDASCAGSVPNLNRTVKSNKDYVDIEKILAGAQEGGDGGKIIIEGSGSGRNVRESTKYNL